MFKDALGTYTDTINLIRNHEMGRGVAKSLGPHRATMLKNHGVVVAGATLEETIISVLMLEEACKIQMIVEAAGNVGEEFSDADVKKLQHDISRPEQFIVNFDYLVRRVQRGGK
jgi:L-fuculose-phosphate aldolase